MAKGLADMHKMTGLRLNEKSRSISPQPQPREVKPVVKKMSNVGFNSTANKMISMDDEIGMHKHKTKSKRKMSKIMKRESFKRRSLRVRSSSWHSGLIGDVVVALPQPPPSAVVDDKANEADDDEVFETRERKNRAKLSKLKLTDDTKNDKTKTTMADLGKQMSAVYATPAENIPSSPKFKEASSNVKGETSSGQDEIFHMEFSDEDNEELAAKNCELNKQQQRTLSVENEKQFMDCVSDIYSLASMSTYVHYDT